MTVTGFSVTSGLVGGAGGSIVGSSAAQPARVMTTAARTSTGTKRSGYVMTIRKYESEVNSDAANGREEKR